MLPKSSRPCRPRAGRNALARCNRPQKPVTPKTNARGISSARENSIDERVRPRGGRRAGGRHAARSFDVIKPGGVVVAVGGRLRRSSARCHLLRGRRARRRKGRHSRSRTSLRAFATSTACPRLALLVSAHLGDSEFELSTRAKHSHSNGAVPGRHPSTDWRRTAAGRFVRATAPRPSAARRIGRGFSFCADGLAWLPWW